MVILIPSALLLILLHESQSAKILCAFTSPAPSHAAVFQPIYKELSLRGHQVTVLTPNTLHDETLTNLTEIKISRIYDILRQNQDRSSKIFKGKSLLLTWLFVSEVFMNYTREILSEVKNIFPGKDPEFDVLILEDQGPLIYSLGYRFKAPTIAVTSNIVPNFNHDLLGNPEHLYPDLVSRTEIWSNFYEKISSVVINMIIKMYYNWVYLPRVDQVAKEFFGQDCPRSDKLIKNVSLMLTNTQPFLHPVRSYIPVMIEMGGFLHIQPEKPLPGDLQKYLDGSPQGVVYFCLGSVSKSSELSETLLDTITQALSELPYHVLWKFELDSLPNQPQNIMIRKWMPQQDVLRHKNIKAFVSHAGLLSTEEAIFNSVPLVVMPLVLDQPGNARKVLELGIGQSVEYLTLTKDGLKNAIMDVAENLKYKDAIRDVRNLLQDKHTKSLNKAVWWIDYIIRHKGADHLKSRSTFSPWYEYFLIDVVATILFLAVTALISVYFCFKIFCILLN